MKKQLLVSGQNTLYFFYVKDSLFYKDRVSYGFLVTKTSTIDFTSTSLIINFARNIIRIEWKLTKKLKT